MGRGTKRDRSYSDTADVSSAIAISSTTSIKIADANPERLFFYVTNNSSLNAVWIKLQSADVDDDKKGIFLPKANTPGGSGVWEMPVDNVYTGEISAIAVGDNPSIYVTEY